jgi:hypothetical protein
VPYLIFTSYTHSTHKLLFATPHTLRTHTTPTLQPASMCLDPICRPKGTGSPAHPADPGTDEVRERERERARERERERGKRAAEPRHANQKAANSKRTAKSQYGR